jgi:hypothetical protein
MSYQDVISRVKTGDESEPEREIESESELTESLSLLVDRENPMSDAAEEALDSL